MARTYPPLGLHQELMLLALHDEKGTVTTGTWYSMALGGGILTELMLQDRVKVETERNKTYLQLVSRKSTGDDVLDEALQKVDSAKRRATLQTWVPRMAGIKQLSHRVAQQLCDLKILRADEKQVLLFFKKRIYPERDHGPERQIIERLESAIFDRSANIAPRTVVLLSLANSGGMLPFLFDKKKLKSRKEHIDNVTSGATLGDATSQAIQSAQTAIMVATMVPIMTTAAIHH